MKHSRVLFLIFIALSLALVFAACGGGGDSGPTNFSNADQASAASTSVEGARALTDMMGQVSSIAMQNVPAGYAPQRQRELTTDKIANIDPRLKDMVDKMIAHVQLPTIQSSISQANSLAVSRATTVTVVSDCPGGGTYSIAGLDSSVVNSFNEFTIDITYTACKDRTGTTYNEISGSMHLYHKVMLDLSSEIADVTLDKLAIAGYENGQEMNRAVLDGVFNNTDNGSNGSSSASGYFELISNQQDMKGKYTFSNVANSWSVLTDATGTTEEASTGGTMSLSLAQISTSNSQALTISVNNLTEKEFTSITGDKDEWINGTISVDFSPNVSGCFEGRFVIATAETDPVHTPYGSYCPTAGTVSINNATIEFGKPSGIMVTVTVNDVTTELNSCDQLGSGGMCI